MSEGDDVSEFVIEDTEKCPLSVLTSVRNMRVNFIGEIFRRTNEIVRNISGGPLSGVPLYSTSVFMENYVTREVHLMDKITVYVTVLLTTPLLNRVGGGDKEVLEVLTCRRSEISVKLSFYVFFA